MTVKQRLGLAYTRLNGWEWDDYLGEKPYGFDNMPRYISLKNKRAWYDDGHFDNADTTKLMTKHDIISPIMNIISVYIGEWRTSWAHWKFNLKRPFIKWLWWYITHKHSNPSKTKRKLYKKYFSKKIL